MDWAKAKTILLAALITANLFLVVVFVVLKAENSADEAKIQQETIALLAEKNIIVETEIPLKHENMPVLNVKNDRLEESFLTRKLEEQVPMPLEFRNEENYLSMTEAFLKSCGIWTEHVVFDSYTTEENRVIISYRNEYEGHRIEDSSIVCVIENGVISEFDRHWLTPISFGRTEKATVSASGALVSFMGDKDRPEKIIIESIEMVYWIDSSSYEGDSTISDTAFPAWKILYNNGQVRHVLAYIE